ncbi:piggyBac transposable element-derived protein 4-like [Ptychodera flava]|uniref:piggyBac transposable element-derived protein 4-like n=1 Tax=Ptychodera flava TaxID=63121 RepID=UPI003969F998
MPRDRFKLILTFFHINDNNNYVRRGNQGYDPLFKIRPFFDAVTARFRSVYKPEQHLSLDEGMVPWRGNISFRQYIPNKPDRFGLKAYQINESSSGYTSVFDIYTGGEYDPNQDGDDDEALKGHTYNVVMGLMRKGGFLNQGHKVYMDNYYNSPELSATLKSEDTIVVGTVRSNRSEMPSALKQKVKRGKAVYRCRDGVAVVKWQDKREVTMISTADRPKWRLSMSKTGDLVVKPSAVVDYNKHMGGTDQADQMVRSYSMHRRRAKWYVKLFFHLLALAITNAYIIYQKYGDDRKMKHSKFRLQIIQELVATATDAPTPAPKGRRSVGQPLRRLDERHFPSPIPPRPGCKKQHPLRQCVVHRDYYRKHEDGKRPPETRLWCRKCEVALCVHPCFEIYHSRRNYEDVNPAA